MNRNLYRILFNHARGLLMVVSENTRAKKRGNQGTDESILAATCTGIGFPINPLSTAARMVAGVTMLLAPFAHSQIIVDANAPGKQRPTILQTANGLPQVNIQTPSAAGVSRNTYNQFDVQSQGAILNNSRTATQTQTGGWVQANPWLAGGAARVILNEVNSSNPSHLHGYVEVAGKKAEVIIANPAGIKVNGGGFINASGITLTTGNAVMNSAKDGELDGYRISKGTVIIDGLGLDASTATYTDILARSVQVNAGIWAERLRVVTGSNEVSASRPTYPEDVGQGVTLAAAKGASPQYSLDVAALGGMYAGHIYLVGSEAGLGVRNQGTISAGRGNMVLLSNGFLVNEGVIQTESKEEAGNLRIETAGKIINIGPDVIISASGNADLASRSTVVNTDGTILAGGDMSIESFNLSNAAGLMQALGKLSINTNGELLDNSRASSHVSGAGGIVSHGALTIRSGDLNNEAGYIGSGQGSHIDAGVVSNVGGGQVVSQADVYVTASSINNTAGHDDRMNGEIQAFGDVRLNVGSGKIDNTGALIRSANEVSLVADLILNRSTSGAEQGIEGRSVSIDVHTLDNHHGAIRSDEATLIAGSSILNNSNGLISSTEGVTIVDNAAQKSLLVRNTDGIIVAGQQLAVDAESIINTGKLLSAKNITLTLSGDFANGGKLQAVTHVEATARNIENTVRGEIAASSMVINAQDELLNRGVINGVKTRVNAGTFTNIGTGRVYGDHLAIAAMTLQNNTETVNETRNDAVIAARDRLDIGVHTLINQDHALIFSAGSATNALNIGGNIDVNGYAAGSATVVTNGSATIESLGDVNIAATKLSNLNLYFTTTLEQIGSPVELLYIQPSDSPNKLLSSNFYWENWSRAGQYRFSASPPPNNSGILGQSPVPRVGEQDCVGDDEDTEVCTRLPGADYLSDNPAWAYFSITAPLAPPTQPALTEPLMPDSVGAVACEPGPGFNASACTAYTEIVADYETNKQAYDIAWTDYRAAHDFWEADTDEKYSLLDDRIAAYNQQFAGSVVRAWTQYAVTRTEKESKVATSDPGQILAGGTIHLAGGDLINDKSRIVAGGMLAGELENLRNIEAQGIHVVSEAGTSQYTYSDWRGGFKRYHQRRWHAPIGYYPADQVTTITLPVTEKAQGAVPVGSGAQLAGHTAPDAMHTDDIGSAANAAGSLPKGLPSNSLFQQNPDPLANYLVETDLRFTQMKQWIGSDYMLAAMSIDPATAQKRLGDGFYEQKIVREQVAELTGRHFLDSYASDELQYQALMDAGITYARKWNLVPGVTLSPSQIAQLTSDIVWLVSHEVILADGSRQTVLVPQVYLQIREGDLNSNGALLAGAVVDVKLSGDLMNEGTIAGRTLTHISALNINNLGGRLTGGEVALKANADINNIGGQLIARDSLALLANRDINVISTTQSGQNESGLSSFSRTGLDRVAGLYVTGSGNGKGTLVAGSGHDVNIAGAVLANYAHEGSTLILAGDDLRLGTIQTSILEKNVRDENNYLIQGNTQDVGSSIIGAGNIALKAGQDINAVAASVDAGSALTINAGRDVQIEAGRKSTDFSEAREHKSSGFLSSTTVTKRSGREKNDAISSELGGETIAITSGRDITLAGSNVISDHTVTIKAENDITIGTVGASNSSASFQEKKTSGLFSGGGISVSYGQQEQSADQRSTRASSMGSTVGSIEGDVNLMAGNQYRQTGSDVVAPGGDIAIIAKAVDIVEATESYHDTTEQHFKQSGLTLAITSPVISAIQTVEQMVQAAGQTKDGRMKVLAGATAALSVKDGYDAAQKGQGILTPEGATNQIPTYDAQGNQTGSRDSTAADQTGGINISISIGASSSESKTSQSGTHAVGSMVIAGGDVHILASGAGEESNVTVRGSNLSAEQNMQIAADNKIELLAAKNIDEQHSTNKSKSGSVGISFGTAGFGVTVSASKGRGNADGSDVSWANAHVNAGEQLTLVSGGDTNLMGAVASGKQVIADVGGDLNIHSLQDTSQYDSKQKSMGGSLTIGAGVSGSVSYSKSVVSSDYASVTEQSGIKAGDGGFQVNVQGHTDMKGAVIASTDQAMKEGSNSFATTSLSMEEIQNSAEYKADAKGVSIGGGSQQGVANLTGAGIGSEESYAGSITKSGISGIAGNEDVRTGHAETGIAKIFDADKVLKEINTQVQVTQAFSQQASKTVADYVQAERKALREQFKKAETVEEKAVIQMQLDELLMQERVMNVLIGAVAGNGGTALTKESLSAAADEMRRISIENSTLFKGVVDGEEGKPLLTNLPDDKSDGLRGDGIKLGGTRVDLDLLCGADNRRCITKKDDHGNQVLNLKEGMVQWSREGAEGRSLAQWLDESLEAKKMYGPTGGIQGWKGTLFNEPYVAGSWQDKLIEAFSGTHDVFGGQITGLYDEQGNIKRGMSSAETTAYSVWSGIAILPSAPFAMSELLPPDIWKAISLFLGAAK